MRSHKSLSIDAHAVARSVSIVFAGLEGFVPVRILAEKGGPRIRPRPSFLPADDHLTAALVDGARNAAAAGGGYFVVPATVARPGRAAIGDVVKRRVVLVDLDEGDIPGKRAHLIEHLGQPSLEVASGGSTETGERKLHLYWLLDEPATGEALKAVAEQQSILAANVAGDPAFKSIAQPIRLPGSIHGKFGRQSPVEILATANQTISLRTLIERVDAMPVLPGLHPKRTKAKDLMDRCIREGGVDGTTRFAAISSVAGQVLHRVRKGELTRQDAWQALQEYNEARIVRPWPEADLRREFERLEALDLRNHGPIAASSQQGGSAPAGTTEDDIARALAARHGADWKYVAARGGWRRWTGSHWAEDGTNAMVELCRTECRLAAERLDPAARSRVLSKRTIQAVECLARSDARMVEGPEGWDADDMLLNTPRGIINLTTGALKPHDRAARMTQITRASPAGECPLWLRFIDRITAGDKDLARYLARVAGYCLTGRMDEEVFFFLHGFGCNGKTVFIGTLADMMGSYARTAPLDSFMASRSDRHPADLASLQGARLITVAETEPNRVWAESRIKAITGRDAISVRYMYGDFFEVQPRYKLVISGNHRPRLSGVGQAMQRRLHLVAFDVTITEEELDKALQDKLAVERDGILAWALEGCLEWQRIGLEPPRRVLDAVRSYLADEDLLGQWLAERCELGEKFRATSRELFHDFRAWSAAAGLEQTGSASEFGERLRERQLRPYRDARTRGWIGLRLTANAGGGA